MCGIGHITKGSTGLIIYHITQQPDRGMEQSTEHASTGLETDTLQRWGTTFQDAVNTINQESDLSQ